MSTLKVDTILKRTGTGTITLGQSGDTITIPSGATMDLSNATQTGVGGTNDNLFRAYNNGSQLMSHDTDTLLEMNTESFDVDAKFDTATYKYTPASVGYYYLNATVFYNFNDSNLGRRIQVWITKNGSKIAQNYQRFIDSGFDGLNENSLSISTVDYSSSASDYYQVYGMCNNANGSDTAYLIQGENQSYFTGYKLIT